MCSTHTFHYLNFSLVLHSCFHGSLGTQDQWLHFVVCIIISKLKCILSYFRYSANSAFNKMHSHEVTLFCYKINTIIVISFGEPEHKILQILIWKKCVWWISLLCFILQIFNIFGKVSHFLLRCLSALDFFNKTVHNWFYVACSSKNSFIFINLPNLFAKCE